MLQELCNGNSDQGGGRVKGPIRGTSLSSLELIYRFVVLVA